MSTTILGRWRHENARYFVQAEPATPQPLATMTVTRAPGVLVIRPTGYSCMVSDHGTTDQVPPSVDHEPLCSLCKRWLLGGKRWFMKGKMHGRYPFGGHKYWENSFNGVTVARILSPSFKIDSRYAAFLRGLNSQDDQMRETLQLQRIGPRWLAEMKRIDALIRRVNAEHLADAVDERLDKADRNGLVAA
jgi:hypothetical protein